MAQVEIIWSQRARLKLYSILEFYAERNKSKVYSAKLYARFNNEIKLLAKHPNLGIKTEIQSVRGLIVVSLSFNMNTMKTQSLSIQFGIPGKIRID